MGQSIGNAGRAETRTGAPNRPAALTAGRLPQIFSRSDLLQIRPAFFQEASMSATLVEIASAPVQPKSKRAGYLSSERFAANQALEEMLVEHGALSRRVPHVSYTQKGTVEHAYARLWMAHLDEVSFWERQAQKFGRMLRVALACDGLSDEDRKSILSGLYRGRSSERRDPRVLSEAEARMMSQYRSMDDASRQMIRTLFDRLAATSENTDNEGGE